MADKPAIPANEMVTSTCTLCNEPFTYRIKLRECGPKGKTKQYIYRKVCDDCQKDNAKRISKQWYKKHIPSKRGFRQSGKMENQPLLRTQQEVAKKLGITVKMVDKAEQKIISTIRNNEELCELWKKVKEEGLPSDRADLFSTATVEMLLDYQMSVVEWWSVYENVLNHGLTEEAATVLREIRKFQNVISGCLKEF